MKEKNEIKKKKLAELKSELFEGFNIDMEKFIKNLKKTETFNFESLKSSSY